MPDVELRTRIAAPPERVFDLARSIDLHVESMARHRERAVAGVTSGLIGAGDEVTWRARHLGVPLTLTSRIVAFDPPRRFRDSQVRGPFARFDHDHVFEPDGVGTLMVDRFDWTSPLGPLGRLADVVVRPALRRLLADRAAAIRRAAEAS